MAIMSAPPPISTTAFSDTGAVRLNLMYTDTGVVDRDFAHSTRWGIAPMIALGLGTDTQWSLAYMHQHTDAHPDYGLAVAQRPGQLIAEPVSEYGVPRNTNTQFNTDIDRNDADIVTMKLRPSGDALADPEQRYPRRRLFALFPVHHGRYLRILTAGTDLEPSIARRALRPGDAASAAGTADPRTALAQIGGSGPYVQNSWGAQDVATAKADFTVGGFRNVAIAGFDVVLPECRSHDLCLSPADPGAIHLSAGRPHGEPPQYRRARCYNPNPHRRRPAIR